MEGKEGPGQSHGVQSLPPAHGVRDLLTGQAVMNHCSKKEQACAWLQSLIRGC